MRYFYSGNAGFLKGIAGRLAQAGFERTDDVGAAEAVVTYCTSQTALEDAYFAEAGFVQAARSGTLLVDLSPSTPNFARELNAVALVSDLAFVEAPVVVEDVVAADAFARRENLVCFAAGEDGDVARAKPLLEALAADVRETGVSGSAQLARAAYTLQTAAQVVSAIEADALFAATLHAQTGSGLAGLRAQGACPRAQGVLDAIAAEGFSGAYTCEMFMAELSAALMAADDADLILPQAESALHLVELLAVIGGSDMAPAALALVYGDEATCARHGLDWTRAEQTYADGEGFEEEDDDCGCGHGHGDYRGFDYSSN